MQFIHDNLGRPVIGISACLLGDNVRYDGGHKYQAVLLSQLRQCVQVQSFCPEVAAGLGIPRPPIHLVASNNGIIRAREVKDPTRDVTQPLQEAGLRFMGKQDQVATALCGFVLKARSPSCGVNSAPIVDDANIVCDVGDGVWVRTLKTARPWLVLAEEEDLTSELAVACFVVACWLVGRARFQLSVPVQLVDLVTCHPHPQEWWPHCHRQFADEKKAAIERLFIPWFNGAT
jgi:uncharacterized protein YbbK (DUF523 family)